ncbi:MAG: cell division protein ZapA [Thermodesulfobacteriota bacterium]
MSDPKQSRLVKVHLLDREYNIRSDDEDKIRRIALYLNEEYSHLKQVSPAPIRADASIMVAFKAASDLLAVREELDCLRREIETTASVLAARIDRDLAGPIRPEGGT